MSKTDTHILDWRAGISTTRSDTVLQSLSERVQRRTSLGLVSMLFYYTDCKLRVQRQRSG